MLKSAMATGDRLTAALDRAAARRDEEKAADPRHYDPRPRGGMASLIDRQKTGNPHPHDTTTTPTENPDRMTRQPIRPGWTDPRTPEQVKADADRITTPPTGTPQEVRAELDARFLASSQQGYTPPTPEDDRRHATKDSTPEPLHGTFPPPGRSHT